MKTKSLLSMLLTCTLFASGCASSSTDETLEEEPMSDEIEEVEEKEDTKETTPSKSTPVLNSIVDTNGGIEETVLYDENDLKITATDLSVKNNELKLTLNIENNSQGEYSFYAGTLGYSANAINSIMIDDGYMNTTVLPAKSASETIGFSSSVLSGLGIEEINEIRLGVYMEDQDGNETLLDLPAITTLNASETSSTSSLLKTMESTTQSTLTEMDPVVPDKNLYSCGDVEITGYAFAKDSDDELYLLLEGVNKSDSPVLLGFSNIEQNGVVLCSSRWNTDVLLDGCQGIITLKLDSMEDVPIKQLVGLDDAGLVTFNVEMRDNDNNVLADAVEVSVEGKGDKEPDLSGTEIYNQNGLQLIFKGITKRYDYASSYSVVILAVNSSDKELSIDLDGDTLSLNDVMVYSYEWLDLDPGQAGIFTFDLNSDDLEAASITGQDEIESIEFRVDIEEGWDTIDSPQITIQP